MKKIALIFGGVSSERLVSVATAQNLVNFLEDPDIYFLSQKGPWYQTDKNKLIEHQNPFKSEFISYGEKVAEDLISAKKILDGKCVVIALHGTEGEDGSIQKFFEENKICFTGSGSSSSALCFDKTQSKVKAKEYGISLAQEIVLDFKKNQPIEDLKLFFKRHSKIVLKPVANGSSFGLFIIDNLEKLQSAVSSIRNSNNPHYLCEEFIEGREMTVGVFENQSEMKALCPSEVLLDKGSNFDYEGKYLGIGSKEITPAMITESEKKQCQDLALKAHQVFGCYGYSRTDMILTSSGPVFLETNTLPGMTKASFYPQQLAADNILFKYFIDSQIVMASTRYL